MKKAFILIILGGFIFTSFTTPPPRWPKEVMKAYMKACVDSAQESLSKKQAKKYCACTARKLEADYPNPDDLKNIGEEVIQKVAMECFKM